MENERYNKGRSLLKFPENYVVIDIETTGFNPSVNKIIEVAAIKYENYEEVASYSSLIKPKSKISDKIIALTGITNEDLSTAPAPEIVLSEFRSFIGDSILIGHNVNFDINFLYDNFEKYLGCTLPNNFVDTLRLSRKYYKNLPSHKLIDMASHLNICVETSHRALCDCQTTNSLYCKLLEASRNPELCTPVESKHTNSSPTTVGEHVITINHTFNEPATTSTCPPFGTPKNKWVALLLCLYTICGHKFYEGKILMGIVYIFTLGLFGIGWIVDIIQILKKPTTYYV